MSRTAAFALSFTMGLTAATIVPNVAERLADVIGLELDDTGWAHPSFENSRCYMSLGVFSGVTVISALQTWILWLTFGPNGIIW